LIEETATRRAVLPFDLRDHVRQGAAGRATRPRLVVPALLVHRSRFELGSGRQRHRSRS
jgi:hypothetical protein